MSLHQNALRGEDNRIQNPRITSTTYPYIDTCDRYERLRLFVDVNTYRLPESEQIRINHRPILRREFHSVLNSNAQANNGSTRYALLSVIIIFVVSLSALFYVYARFPQLENDEKPFIKIPWDIEEAKQLGIVLDRYKDRYYFEVISGIFVTYIFLQTFAIPGSLFLSILSGFLFPFLLALILVCVCSAIGASLCYLLSQLLGRRLVQKFFPERAHQWSLTVNKHRDHLFNYILFLRVTPFLPNWFINLVAPVIGVPLVPFAFGTFLGVAPPSFVAIQAGQTLYKMTSSSDAWSWASVLLLAVFALLSLVPVLLKKQLKDKFE